MQHHRKDTVRAPETPLRYAIHGHVEPQLVFIINIDLAQEVGWVPKDRLTVAADFGTGEGHITTSSAGWLLAKRRDGRPCWYLRITWREGCGFPLTDAAIDLPVIRKSPGSIYFRLPEGAR